MTVGEKTGEWIWIGGWGLPPEWLRAHAERGFPSRKHTVIAPGPEALESIDWLRFDRACGYSLGAFLLLQKAEKVPLPGMLIAPFFAYAAEDGLGGRIRRGQIRYLARWLQRDSCDALADFYERAGVELERPAALPYSMEDLQWGLEQLAEEQVRAGLPEGWTGVVGDEDSLLDANVLRTVEPRLQVAPGAGHHPAALMQAMSSLA